MRLLFGVLILSLLLIAAPAFAQDDTTHTLTVDGFGFTYESTLGANVNITTYPGDSPADAMPGFADAPYTQFLFYDAAPAPESLFDMGGVRVYRVQDTLNYDFIADQVSHLSTLLSGRVDLTQFMQTTPDANTYVLPFLPVMPAAQVIRARATVIEGESVHGLVYLTVYRQDASPFTSDEFLYTFQGISTDGQYYVSAVFRVNTDLFPAEVPADFNYDEFIADLQTYFADSITTLNDATPADFTPSLDTLDALFASFTVQE